MSYLRTKRKVAHLIMRPQAGATFASRGVRPRMSPGNPSCFPISSSRAPVVLLEAAPEACLRVLITSNGFVHVAAICASSSADHREKDHSTHRS
jgi:hypothetical protein